MSLESRYRRLLRIYPRAYRDRRGEEMLATLLDAAGPGQTRPSRRDVADLVSGAARERLGLHAVPGAAAGLRIATPVLLVIAAGFAASDWLIGTRTPLSTVVAVVWLLAILLRLALSRAGATPVGLAVAVTFVAIIGAASSSTPAESYPLGSITYPTAGLVSLVFLCGLIGWVGLTLTPLGPAATRNALSTRQERLAVTIAVVGLVGSTALIDGVDQAGRYGWPFTGYPSWSLQLWVLPTVVALVGIVVGIRRQHSGWLWAALLLLIPGVTAIPSTVMRSVVFRSPLGDMMTAELGGPGIAVVVCAVALIAVLLTARNNIARDGVEGATTNGRQPARSDSDGLAALRAAGAMAQGAIIAVCLYLAAAAAALGAASVYILPLVLVAVLASVALFTPGRWHYPLISLTVAAAVAAVYSGGIRLVGVELLLTIAAILIVVLATGARPDPGNSDDARVGRRSRIMTAALAGVSTALVVGFLTWLSTGRLFVDEHDPYRALTVAPCVVGILLVPTAYWAAKVVVRSAHGWIGAAVALAASLAWITAVIGGLTDSRLLAAVIALVVLTTLGLRQVRRRAYKPSPVI